MSDLEHRKADARAASDQEFTDVKIIFNKATKAQPK